VTNQTEVCNPDSSYNGITGFKYGPNQTISINLGKTGKLKTQEVDGRKQDKYIQHSH